MLKLRPTTLDGLRRFMRAHEGDVFDLLEEIPRILHDVRKRQQAEEREAARKAWLEAYRPDLARCAAESDA